MVQSGGGSRSTALLGLITQLVLTACNRSRFVSLNTIVALWGVNCYVTGQLLRKVCLRAALFKLFYVTAHWYILNLAAAIILPKLRWKVKTQSNATRTTKVCNIRICQNIKLSRHTSVPWHTVWETLRAKIMPVGPLRTRLIHIIVHRDTGQFSVQLKLL